MPEQEREERELNAIAISVFGKQLISLDDTEMAQALKIRNRERALKEDA